MTGKGYCSLKLDSVQAKEINKIMKVAGIECIPPSEMHCTLMYDESDPNIKILKNTSTYTAKVKGVKLLGDAIVLELDSPGIEKRHKELKNAGYKHSFPKLLVHMSINYDPKSTDKDLLELLIKLKGIPKVLKFGNEKFSPLKK